MARVAEQEARLNYLSGLIHDQIEPKIVEEYTTLKAWGLNKPMMSIVDIREDLIRPQWHWLASRRLILVIYKLGDS